MLQRSTFLRPRRTIVIALVSSLVSSSLSAAETNDPQTEKIRLLGGTPPRVVEDVSGQLGNIEIGSNFGLDRDCRPQQVFDYELLTLPQHGEVCYRYESLKVSLATGAGREKCVGRFIMANVIYYQSNDDYIGVDVFQYKALDWSDVVAIVDVNVTIAPRPAGAAGTSPLRSISGESVGRMPKCADPAS
jgi:hypothetical protein